ncbi:hypothetical protein [Streptomyces roseolilacinus]|uniref:DNA-binding protein n=1 Tax=Streptomyces roseolilacinus TaxID=66904 RepID=A0A918EJ92_9ACTN|nr:hypothetical protein [Streptomyces roseolilacinus]GGP95390.1 hypothetical protein GCM10010249_11800 [Streptomyces roseolilacinus]
MSAHGRTPSADLLEAGAILPPGTTDREDADTLTVRTYGHPALDGRRIVRLVPGTLGEAEDLALDFLGLTREQDAPEVGQVRRETLGFPAWALVNDPANGHHALALVKDVERLARQAKSRAGAAKQGFEALGERLGRTVPHFLPTFHEQAARVFLGHENTTYAAAFFGKAREAERVHGLAVDEERQRAVFLEFAFAGALTVKALKEYVKDLTRRLDPAEAWAQFRQLAVERCAAGMPPYASLPQDARGLIKAAGLDRAAEERAFVADLVASPSVVRAPRSFWTTYRPVLADLAEDRPEVRARLLEILPTELGRTVEDDEWWLGLLAESGADTLLTDGAADGAADVDAAGWLGRWAAYRKHGSVPSDRSAATLALVERMAPRLRADGRPVDLFSRRVRSGADLDLLDLCVAQGIPLAAPGDDAHLPLHSWLRDRGNGRRDLASLGADPRFHPLLYRAVGALGEQREASGLLEEVAGHPVLRGVLRAWLDEAAAALGRARGLPGARAALRTVRPFRAVVERVNPTALARIAAHEVAPLLGRTLRAGVLDELGWPALDDALRLLPEETGNSRGGEQPTVTEAWPALVLARGDKAVVVGPEGVLLEHDLRVPGDIDRWRRPSFRYVDGELLVTWWHEGKWLGYWSARPSEVFTVGGDQPSGWHGEIGTPSIPLPGGGRATGGRALHAGDTDLPAARPVLGDGTAYWRRGRQDRRHVWLEYDPVSGTHGRASLPAFLRSGIRDDARLVPEACEVLPVQPGLEDSPFGTDGAVLGRWVRREGEGDGARVSAGTPDGRTVTLPAASDRRGVTPLGALRMPGGAEPVAARRRGVVTLSEPGDTSDTGELGHCTPGQRGGEFAAGTRFVPPVAFWHALRPRDEAGSAALRGLTDERAAELLAAVGRALAERQAEVEAVAEYTGPSAHEVARRVVSEAVPELTDERLLTGVASLVQLALRHAQDTAGFVTPADARARGRAERAEEMFADYSPEHGDDTTLVRAVAGLTSGARYMWWGPGTRWSVLRQVRAVNHVLSGKPAEGRPLPDPALGTALEGGWHSDGRTLPGTGVEWVHLLSALRPLAYRAASPAVPDAEREALLLLFDALLEGPLAAPRGEIREVVLREERGRQGRVGQVLRREGRTVVVLAGRRSGDRHEQTEWLALDHDPAGRFGAIAHFTLDEERLRTPGFPAERLAAVARLVRDKGAAPWYEDAPAALAAATGGGLGPVQAALLLGALPQDPPTGTLALMGLKPRRYDLGRGLLQSLAWTDQAALVGALLPEDPADLWTSGPDTDGAGRTWERRLGSLVRLPEDIAPDLAGVPAGIAEAMLNPGRTPWLSRTTVQRPGKDGDLVADDPAAVPGRYELQRAVYVLAALAYRLPYGHPLRAALPEGLAALRRRVSDPGLLLDLDLSWTEKGTPTAVRIRKAYGLPPAGGADAQGLTAAGEALVLRPWYGDTEAVLLRPAALTGPDDPVLGLLEGLVGGGRVEAVNALRALLGEDLARTVAAGTAGDAPAGHAHDPSVSVPGLVAEVASVHGLSGDAAVLYLQLLALPDPTDRACADWTGWRPARIRKARAELAATDLVVEAKRSRAGRSLFLPCGWRDLASPALPLETWKEGLYPVHDRSRAVPLLPVPDLFARAWGRVRDGDAPAFEELTTRATRKGRRR